jgi:hypothetical protein
MWTARFCASKQISESAVPDESFTGETFALFEQPRFFFGHGRNG